MNWSKHLAKELELKGKMMTMASGFPGNAKAPYIKNAKRELKRICDWLVSQQIKRGTWIQGEKNFRFYSDSYAVRALLAASHILKQAKYREAAVKWVKHMIKIQRNDGGWWVGYSWGDHAFDAKDADQSVAYLADAGEVTMGLVPAYHFLAADPKTKKVALDLKSSLLKFRGYAEQFRLASGAFGNGYTQRNLFKSADEELEAGRFVNSQYYPFAFSTAVTGVNFYAGFYTISGNPEDWEKAMQSLDWCLEHTDMDKSNEMAHKNEVLDFKHFHRIMDIVYDACDESCERAKRKGNTPEPRYRSSQRQKLYALWKSCLHFLAETQSAEGEWPIFRGGRELIPYRGDLRHRLYFLYSLTAYLQNHGAVKGEDEILSEARNRQIWLCMNRDVLHEHYGVCQKGEHMMPTGLWGMTLSELLKPGITLPRKISKMV